MYEKVLTLSELVGSTEQYLCICSRQRNWDNTPNRFSGTVSKADSGNTFPGYDFLRTSFALIPSVMVAKSKEAMAEVGKILQQKWDIVL